MTHYETLQISPNASPELVEAAWKTLMLKHHPDKGGNPKKAARINEAHDVLSDPKKREAYDLTLKKPSKPKVIIMPQAEPRYPAAYPAYPAAYPASMPNMNKVAQTMVDAGMKAMVAELEKNLIVKTVLDLFRKQQRRGA